MNIIQNSNYDFYNPADLKNKFNIPRTNKQVLITIDDAFESFYLEAWPYLKKKKFHLYCLFQLNLLEKEAI